MPGSANYRRGYGYPNAPMTSPDLARQEPDSAQAELATPSYGLPGLAREPASARGLVSVQP